MEPQARVCARDLRLGATSFNPKWHEQQLFVPLLLTHIAPEEARARISAMLAEHSDEQTRRPQYDLPAEAAAHRTALARDTPRTTDAAQWRVHFGDDDDEHHVQGIVRVEEPVSSVRKYGVVVTSGGGPAATALHSFVLAHPEMTVGELLHTPEYRLSAEYASRNARRIAALIGGALTAAGLETVMPCEPDRRDFQPHEQIASEMLACPTLHVTHNCFDEHGLPPQLRTPGVRDEVFYRTGVQNLFNGANDGRGNVRSLRMLDVRAGFVQRTHRLTDACTGVEPVAAFITCPSQMDNEAFMQSKENRAQLRANTQRHFLTRGGGVPSSNARAFWRFAASPDSIHPADVRLVPEVMIVHAQNARVNVLAQD